MATLMSCSFLRFHRHLPNILKTRRDVSTLVRLSACNQPFTSNKASGSSAQHPHEATSSSLVMSIQSRLWRPWIRPCSSLVPSFQSSSSSAVIEAVSSEVNQGMTRLFAVIYFAGLQHKVTTGDLVLVQKHIPADVGERIRLEKVMLVGGDNFTLIGKPLLSLDNVRVEATIIEKTISHKKIHFLFRKRKRSSKYHEIETDQTVVRINSIEVSPKLR